MISTLTPPPPPVPCGLSDSDSDSDSDKYVFANKCCLMKPKVHYLKNPTDIQGTLNKLPFFMDAEKSMMLALLKAGPKAHIDALVAVPKNLQLMYL